MVVLDLEKWQWSTPSVAGPTPRPRFVHRMITLGHRLLLFGGRTSEQGKYNDVHVFDTRTSTWARGEAVGGRPHTSHFGCLSILHRFLRGSMEPVVGHIRTHPSYTPHTHSLVRWEARCYEGNTHRTPSTTFLLHARACETASSHTPPLASFLFCIGFS